jgi:hypothetical protein
MKCVKCNLKATQNYSPDIDLKNVGMCDEHEEEIMLDILRTKFDPQGWEKFEKKYNYDRKSTD